MKLNISKTRVISFSRKTTTLFFQYKLCHSSITRTDFIRDLGVFIDSKLHFHNHIDYIFSQCIKLLGLVQATTFPFYSIGPLYILYCTLIRSKFEYASFVWNSVTTTDANKVERIQQKFAALCYNRFLPQVYYTYSNALEHLKLHSLRKRRDHLEALFLIQVYLDSKFCPSVLETVGLRVLTRHLRDFPMFYVCPKFKTVLLLDVLQLLMLSARTLMSLEIIMFPWNTFYSEQDTVFMLSIYLIVCVKKSILFFFLVLLFYVRL
jgi:hypothetical protein